MDADIVHNNVCVDAIGFGFVLDRVKHIWNWSNVVVKT